MIKNNISILIIDDENDICEMVSIILKDEGYKTKTANNFDEAINIIQNENISLIITDIWMNNNTKAGLEILQWSKKYNSLIPVIMMSGHGNIETAMIAAKTGAFDFIEKPFKSERLLLLVEKALNDRNLKIKISDYEAKEKERLELIGKSLAIRNIKAQLNKLSTNNSRILITGPSGSGKELVARLIHKKSIRDSFPFIIASCATLSPERVEQVLFGWSNLTDKNNINNSNVGLFEQANHGTLFFDEICDLPLQTQGKIVQAIQDQSFYKIDSNNKVHVDVRIISASNQNLLKSIEKGILREDLFYRLSVVPIEMPPLNKRTEDINSLVEYFFKLLTKDLTSFNLNLSPETLAIFQNYDWPGNVRQLENVLEWLIIMHGSQKDYLIKPTDLPPEILGHDSMINKKNNASDLELSLKDARKIFEANYLKQQLIRFKGNIARTSNFVGMDRSALHRKIKELDININKFN
ncbi:sigma-54 dependent transcriptional regulator [Candidatus Levibacter sp. Uisw_134_01]|uniref:sigma-54-dependent transcriptional regulator n=1 Tax=Candidatus Levibacter sp. Uisw_134_01 TaxID=3230999 RepID=UPI003D5B0D9A